MESLVFPSGGTNGADSAQQCVIICMSIVNQESLWSLDNFVREYSLIDRVVYMHNRPQPPHPTKVDLIMHDPKLSLNYIVSVDCLVWPIALW